MDDIEEVIREDQENIPTVHTDTTDPEMHVRVENVLRQTGMDPTLMRFLPMNVQNIPTQNVPTQNLPTQTVHNILTQTVVPTQSVTTQNIQNMPTQNVAATQPIEVININSDGNTLERFITVQSEQGGHEIYQINPEQKQSAQHTQQLPQHFITAPKSRTTIGAVPKEQQIDPVKKYYCNRCPHKYFSRAELLRHQRQSCLITN